MLNALGNNKGFILWILCLVQFTLSADVANLSISTSTLLSTFDTNISSIQLLGSIQPLVGAACMLSASMVGLIIGWRRLLILGTGLGLISSIGIILFEDVRTIITFIRPLTGLASALMLPAVLALIVAHFPGKQRAIGFGLMAGATGLAAALIPLLSGWMHDHLDWQWPFRIIIGLYFLSFCGAIFGIPPIHTNQPAKLDIVGMGLGALSTMMLFFGLISMPHWGFFTVLDGANIPSFLSIGGQVSPALIMFLIGCGLLAVFVLQQVRFESKYGHTLLPLAWLTQSIPRRGFVTLALMYIVLGGSSFVCITYMQVAISLSTAHSGGIILLFSAFMISFSIITPILFKSMKPRQLCRYAFIIMVAAGILLTIWSKEDQLLLPFYFGMGLLGMCMGILASQCPVIITNALGSRDAEQSGGLQATVRNIGLVVGITLFGGINQVVLDYSLRANHEIRTYYPTEFIQTLASLPRIPYVDDSKALSITKDFSLDVHQTNYLLSVNAKARVRGFNTSMLFMMLIALSGYYLNRPKQSPF